MANRAQKPRGATKSEPQRRPVEPHGPGLARGFWGKAWHRHVERFGAFGGRMQRGRELLLAGAVLDLRIERGKLTAIVRGSREYRQTIVVQPLSERWCRTLRTLAHEGRTPSAPLRRRMVDGRHGVFPRLSELATICTCPDRAELCKHVAAALLALAVRLDEAPELLFRLRGIEETAEPATEENDATPAARRLRPVDIAPPSALPSAPSSPRIRRAFLKSLGIAANRIDAWLAAGILRRTAERGVYERSPAASREIAAALRR